MVASSAGGAAPVKRAAHKLPKTISDRFIGTICQRLVDGKRVRRMLPVWGRLHIDRQLPFLCVYRLPRGREDAGTKQLVQSEAAYLIATAEKRQHQGLALLVNGIARTLSDVFGSFLLVEVWAGPDVGGDEQALAGAPTFKLVLPKKHTLASTVLAFEQALLDIELHDEVSNVTLAAARNTCPPGLPSLLQPAVAAQLGCHVLGIEVRPVYRDLETGRVLPLVHQALRRRLGQAYKLGFFDFVRRHTSHRPAHYHALGPRAMVQAVWTADQQLAQVSNSFDMLLGVTPTNADEAWAAFKRSHFESLPEFSYRPLPMDPVLLKRRLFKIPLERIEDPTLAYLFRNQQTELDRKISLLAERNTVNFLFTSMQLFGQIDDALLGVAGQILTKLPAHSRSDGERDVVDARTFARHAQDELDRLRQTLPELSSTVAIRSDVVGLMVSHGNLLVGSRNKIPQARIAALIAHEVGTHIVTYWNGRAQPFRQLHVGLPGYEELQEGLAVFAEYLTGGLNSSRLRLLAARVVAARRVLEGASFIDTFRELNKTYGFAQRIAFGIVLRAFRGGGFTKDAVYLRGLSKLLDYLKTGGPIDLLLMGKFALDQVPIMEELRLRKVLRPPVLRPSHMSESGALARLERARNGISVLDLVEPRKQRGRR